MTTSIVRADELEPGDVMRCASMRTSYLSPWVRLTTVTRPNDYVVEVDSVHLHRAQRMPFDLPCEVWRP